LADRLFASVEALQTNASYLGAAFTDPGIVRSTVSFKSGMDNVPALIGRQIVEDPDAETTPILRLSSFSV
jgi:hypothetical protein